MKRVKCPTCGNTQNIDEKESIIKCLECGHIGKIKQLDYSTRIPPPPNNNFSIREIIKNVKKTVVIIEGATSFGAGVIISDIGLIITNKHVLGSGISFRITLSDGTSVPSVVIDKHPSKDLAILKAPLLNVDYFNVHTNCSSIYEAGDDVLAIGHPRGLRFTSTRGMISVERQFVENEFYVQTDVAINPGNSGGPLLDLQGKLIGINTLIIDNSTGLSFAIPSSEIKKYYTSFIDRVKKDELKIPNNDEIFNRQINIAIDQIIKSAFEIIQLPYNCFAHENVVIYESIISDSYVVFVVLSEEALFVGCKLGFYYDYLASDPEIAEKLLELNANLNQAKYSISDDELQISVSRPCEDLDVSEVAFMITEVGEAAIHFNNFIN